MSTIYGFTYEALQAQPDSHPVKQTREYLKARLVADIEERRASVGDDYRLAMGLQGLPEDYTMGPDNVWRAA